MVYALLVLPKQDIASGPHKLQPCKSGRFANLNFIHPFSSTPIILVPAMNPTRDVSNSRSKRGNLSQFQVPPNIENLYELVKQGLPSPKKQHIDFLRMQTPKFLSAIKPGHAKAFLSQFYLQYVLLFPEQWLTLSTKDFVQRFKYLEGHIYVGRKIFRDLIVLTLSSSSIVLCSNLLMTRCLQGRRLHGTMFLHTCLACAISSVWWTVMLNLSGMQSCASPEMS